MTSSSLNCLINSNTVVPEKILNMVTVNVLLEDPEWISSPGVPFLNFQQITRSLETELERIISDQGWTLVTNPLQFLAPFPDLRTVENVSINLAVQRISENGREKIKTVISASALIKVLRFETPEEIAQRLIRKISLVIPEN